MHFLLRKCRKCGRYTLKDVCPACGTRTVVAHPPRFSPIDKYVRYRVLLKEESLAQKAPLSNKVRPSNPSDTL